MRTLTMGEFYVWYCEWCDSRNLTPWVQTMDSKVVCGCCHKEFPVAGAKRPEAVGRLRQAAF